MTIKKRAIAGTFESSDIHITIAPETKGIRIELESTVMELYGKTIQALLETILHDAGVKAAYVKAQDYGALDCTIRARMQTALRRSQGEEMEHA